MMKGKREIKENLGKVEPGSDFREGKLIIPFATVFS